MEEIKSETSSSNGDQQADIELDEISSYYQLSVSSPKTSVSHGLEQASNVSIRSHSPISPHELKSPLNHLEKQNVLKPEQMFLVHK